MAWYSSLSFKKKRDPLRHNRYSNALEALVKEKNGWQKRNDTLAGVAKTFAGLASKDHRYTPTAREAAYNSAAFHKLHDAYQKQVREWTKARSKSSRTLSEYPFRYSMNKSTLIPNSAVATALQSIKKREQKRNKMLGSMKRNNANAAYHNSRYDPKSRMNVERNIESGKLAPVHGFYTTRHVSRQPMRTVASALQNARNAEISKLNGYGHLLRSYRPGMTFNNDRNDINTAAKHFRSYFAPHEQLKLLKNAVKLVQSGKPLTTQERFFVDEIATMSRYRSNN